MGKPGFEPRNSTSIAYSNHTAMLASSLPKYKFLKKKKKNFGGLGVWTNVDYWGRVIVVVWFFMVNKGQR